MHDAIFLFGNEGARASAVRKPSLLMNDRPKWRPLAPFGLTGGKSDYNIEPERESMKRIFALMAVALLAATATARAQETPSPAAPVPAATPTPTFLDREYDGRTHIMLAPYVWAPTVKGNFQYTIPTLHNRKVRILQPSVNVGPSEYLPKLNSAAMFAFDARKGDVDLFGDVIYLNASTSASFASTLSGPLGKVQIPVSVDSSARLSLAIWEAALGVTVARGHDADLSLFTGLRQFPVNLAVSYSATVGRRGIIAPSGSLATGEFTSDVIVGLRGRAFVGDRLYIPYYIDVGSAISGANNQTWEAYGGGGYAFNHGQTLVALWRALNYNAFPPTAHVQRLSMGGPLLGYTFNL